MVSGIFASIQRMPQVGKPPQKRFLALERAVDYGATVGHDTRLVRTDRFPRLDPLLGPVRGNRDRAIPFPPIVAARISLLVETVGVIARRPEGYRAGFHLPVSIIRNVLHGELSRRLEGFSGKSDVRAVVPALLEAAHSTRHRLEVDLCDFRDEENGLKAVSFGLPETTPNFTGGFRLIKYHSTDVIVEIDEANGVPRIPIEIIIKAKKPLYGVEALPLFCLAGQLHNKFAKLLGHSW